MESSEGILNKYFRVIQSQDEGEAIIPDFGEPISPIQTKLHDDGMIIGLVPSQEPGAQLVNILRFRDRARGWTHLNYLKFFEWPVGFPLFTKAPIPRDYIIPTEYLRADDELHELEEIEAGTYGRIMGYRDNEFGLGEIEIWTEKSTNCWVPLHFVEVGPRLVGDVRFDPLEILSSRSYSPSHINDHWTRIDYPDGSIMLRRNPRQLINFGDNTSNNLNIIHIPFVSKLGPFVVRDLQTRGLHGLQFLYPVVEIFPPGRRHPMCWSRQMTVGPWSDWSLGETVALKIQWKAASGSWKQTYLSASDQVEFLNDLPGLYRPYCHATALRRYLLQQKLESTKDFRQGVGHLLPKGPRIRKLTFDHYNQILSAQKIEGFVETLPPPDEKDLAEVGSELAASGLRFLEHSSYPVGRDTCDGCHVEGISCLRTEAGTCNRCDDFGRPCSFTPTDELMDDRQRAALWISPKNPSVVQDIGRPHLLQLEEEYLVWHFANQQSDISSQQSEI